MLVISAIAATARQLGPGRQPTPLPGSRPGLPGPSTASNDPDYPPFIRFQQYNLAEIARGGVGTVYRAVHPTTGQSYAIKQLSRQFVSDQLVVDAFHRGAAMLIELRHPSIVRVYYDWSEQNDGWLDHFVIMELLPGVSLLDLIRSEAPLPLDEGLIDIVAHIAEAVAYLHAHQIVHRDIKPENFRFADGRYKLLDFDTAISRVHPGLAPQDGMPIGTPEYMSPEQARGLADIDPRADVYSFGMLLYELLTGAVPFTGAPSRVLIDQMETPPRSPRSLNDRVPQPVADVILMALSKDRNRRFNSIQALMTAFLSACGLSVAKIEG